MSRRQHVAVRTSATSRILLIITAIMGLLAFCWPLFLNPGALPTMRRAPRFFSPRSCPWCWRWWSRNSVRTGSTSRPSP